ncbi:hypothetical protein ACQCVK_13400 [Rossellomorea vietnamensis]|uniref:hypothetical protein n=1 Tax=Rossellomorea vietnamensis TaxID=218284 RepID=UPI003CF27CF2
MEICMMLRLLRSGEEDILGDMYDAVAASIARAAFPFQIYMMISGYKSFGAAGGLRNPAYFQFYNSLLF